MASRYFIQQYLHLDYEHGGIGCVDAERILLQEGYQAILLPHQKGRTWITKFRRFISLRKLLPEIDSGSAVLFITPTYARMTRLLIRLLLRKKDVQVICMIADINGLKDGDPLVLEEELRLFRRIHYFIVHNETMKDWVQEHVPDARCGVINFFDFPAKAFTGTRSFSYEIAFAGNLDKSRFLEQLQNLAPSSPHLHFHLYGPGVTAAMRSQPNVSYHGVIPAHEISDRLKGSFGLIWDGDSVDNLKDNLGVYMRYISQHKLSLYIVSRLPVIVHESAASASLVRKYNIGIVVKKLYDLEEALGSVQEDQYKRMQDNMAHLSQKIVSGACLRSALDELEL